MWAQGPLIIFPNRTCSLGLSRGDKQTDHLRVWIMWCNISALSIGWSRVVPCPDKLNQRCSNSDFWTYLIGHPNWINISDFFDPDPIFLTSQYMEQWFSVQFGPLPINCFFTSSLLTGSGKSGPSTGSALSFSSAPYVPGVPCCQFWKSSISTGAAAKCRAFSLWLGISWVWRPEFASASQMGSGRG